MKTLALILFLSFLLLGSGIRIAVADQIILECVADAFICNDDWADRNFGNPSSGFSPRAVGRQNEYTGQQIGRQLYRFEVPDWVSSATSAELHIKVFDNFAGFPAETSVFGLSDDWQEMAVTWNTQPPHDSDLLDTVNAYCCGIVYVYDVTGYVQEQLGGGDMTICFIQRAPDESIIGGLRWFQRESDGHWVGDIQGESPKLYIYGEFTGVKNTTWGQIKALYRTSRFD